MSDLTKIRNMTTFAFVVVETVDNQNQLSKKIPFLSFKFIFHLYANIWSLKKFVLLFLSMLYYSITDLSDIFRRSPAISSRRKVFLYIPSWSGTNCFYIVDLLIFKSFISNHDMVSQPQHWYFKLDNSLLWSAVLCIIGCWANPWPLPSSYQ